MRWTGFSGAPGYTNLHFQNPEADPSLAVRDAAAGRIRTFFQAFVNYIPAGVTIAYPTAFERFNTGTGVLEGENAFTPLSNSTGAATGNYSSATGACVNWRTGLIVNGRRLRGRTFMVPLGAIGFGTDGTLSDSARTAMLTAATTLIDPTITDLVLAVWHKPIAGAGGESAQVSGTSITDKSAVLRSRRD